MQLGPFQSVLPALNPSTNGAACSIDCCADNGSTDSAVQSVDHAALSTDQYSVQASIDSASIE